MRLTFSENAKVQKQQRGFSTLSLEIVEQFANEKNQTRGKTVLFFGRKEAAQAAREFKNMIQMLDKASGCCLIVKDGQVLNMQKG